MLSPWQQIRLLAWKNYLLQIRNPFATLIEILVPLFFFLLLVAIRFAIKDKNEAAEVFCRQYVSTADATNSSVACPVPELLNSFTLGFDNGAQEYSTIAFMPNTSEVRSIMEVVKAELAPVFTANDMTIEFTMLSSESELSTVIKENTLQLFAAIAFTLSNGDAGVPPAAETPLHVAYKLRMPADLPGDNFDAEGDVDGPWLTKINFPVWDNVNSRTYDEIPYFMPSGTLLNNGFMLIQAAVDRAVTTHYDSGGVAPQFIPRLKSFPFPEHNTDDFVFVLRGFFPFILVLSFCYTVMNITKTLVREKQTRMREAMRLMGLSNWVNWCSWFLKDFAFLFVVAILIVLIFSLGGLVHASSRGVILIFFLWFILVVIAFSYMVSTFFSNATIGGIVSLVLFFLLYVPYSVVSDDGLYDRMTVAEKRAMCLAAPSCMGVGARILSQFESRGVGLQLSNLNDNPSDNDEFSMDDVFGMLFLDILLYGLIAWYVDNVFPGQYGIPKHPLFFLSRAFWLGQPAKDTVSNPVHQVHGDLNELMDMTFVGDMESVPSDANVGIELSDLRKEWPVPGGGVKIAVQKLSLKFLKEQVTVLLGQNGAGKTTTLSMLTGMYAPTSGRVSVNGSDIVTDTTGARRSLGLCPQFDILWGALTVEEHMYFFAKLKGQTDKAKIKQEMDQLLGDLNIKNKRTARAGTLSGGQKRALSVSLAFIGGTETVILDEPTSGMDPSKRRQTWDLIQKHKANRTIVLTTHFMDEADLLGDRIAIMRDGILRCAGTPLFLKDRFGCGYHMTIVKADGCNERDVTAAVVSHVPSALLEDDIGAELTYKLPKSEASRFPALFSAMESQREQLRIESYGAGVTTMEDVFLRINLDSMNAEKHDIDVDGNDDIALVIPEDLTNRLEGTALQRSHIQAMLYKRWLHFRRNPRLFIAQVVLPMFFVVIAIVIAKYGSSPVVDVEPCRLFGTTGYNFGSPGVYVSEQNTGYDTAPHATEAEQVTATLMGSLQPTSQQESLLDNLKTFLGSSTLTSNADVEDISGQNYTDVLLDRSSNYKQNLFFRENVEGVAFERGSIWISEACDVREGSTYVTKSDPLMLLSGAAYILMLVSTDFVSTSGESLALTTTGATFTDTEEFYNFTTNGAQGLNNPLVQWIDINVMEGENYTVHCPGGQQLDFESTTDMSAMYNTTAVTAYAWYNRQAYHAAPEALNLASNAIAQTHLGRDFQLTTSNCPLPKTNEQLAEEKSASSIAFNLSFWLLLGLSFLAASFTMAPVAEKQSKAKHIQFVSGVRAFEYWLGSYVFDFVTSLLPLILITIATASSGINGLEGSNSGIIFLLLFLFVWAVLPLLYALTYLYKTPASGIAITVLIFFLVTLAMIITVFVLPLVANGRYRRDGTTRTVKLAFMTNPMFASVQGIIDVYQNKQFLDLCADRRSFCSEQSYEPRDDYFAMDGLGVGTECLFLFCEGFAFALLLYAVERANLLGTRATRTPSGDADTDADVATERQRVDAGDIQNDLVVLHGLTKRFGKVTAVDNVTFGIPSGQCFGLLGVNGAGKTSCFRMLTGELGITKGSARICGSDVSTALEQARRDMGYCPQYDGIIPQMTGRELLYMLALLRGIRPALIRDEVARVITMLDLDTHCDRLSGTYSGGNKRKLSTGMALIGSPKVVFLDEPTSGMDPGARRMLWNAVIAAVKMGTTVVLTSHSMEECEALCNRLTIMVGGHMKCIGSPGHLKDKFGQGFHLLAKTETMEQGQQLQDYLRGNAPGLEMTVHAHKTQVVSLQITGGATLAQLFEWMEAEAGKALVQDYSVNQTTLEQVFLSFAGAER